ncbi:hypothetical protein LP420_17405 [Massilia sp. B-10]|nr:hypothetical protein LP420_17405 [Massilia sp. B-10]
MALGRVFTLKATLPKGASRKLQLVAENGKVIAEAAGSGATLAVQWLPPVAETLVLEGQAARRPLSRTIAEGPVPLDVRDPLPLQVQGRFGAPSFDTRTLNQLLAQSNAILDWQITLGKVVTRSEPRAAIARADLLVVDAAYLERLPVARVPACWCRW